MAGLRSAKYPPLSQSVPGALVASHTSVSAPRSGDLMARRNGEFTPSRTAGGPERPHLERTIPGCAAAALTPSGPHRRDPALVRCTAHAATVSCGLQSTVKGTGHAHRRSRPSGRGEPRHGAPLHPPWPGAVSVTPSRLPALRGLRRQRDHARQGHQDRPVNRLHPLRARPHRRRVHRRLLDDSQQHQLLAAKLDQIDDKRRQLGQLSEFLHAKLDDPGPARGRA